MRSFRFRLLAIAALFTLLLTPSELLADRIIFRPDHDGENFGQALLVMGKITRLRDQTIKIVSAQGDVWVVPESAIISIKRTR